MSYQKILIAVDLSQESGKVIAAGLEQAKAFDAHIELVHVCDHHMTGYGEHLSHGLVANEMQLREAIFPHLKALADENGIPVGDLHIYFGRVADELHDHARKQESDLIVIGSHGKSGIRALLGSTASSVVHGSQSNVLVVRV